MRSRRIPAISPIPATNARVFTDCLSLAFASPVAEIVKEQDVQEYVRYLRAKFHRALEDVLIAVIQCAKNGKNGGLLGYRMLVDAGVIPQKVRKSVRPLKRENW